jgi:steroid 5-alpha reductase family enzyme
MPYPFSAAALGLLLLATLFALGRWWAGRIDNFGILDVLWTYGFLLTAALAAVLGPGWGPRRIVMALLVATWSLRLGTHVVVRVARAHPREDPRYGQWRRAWGRKFASRMTGFFQLQAASVVLLSTAFFVACANLRPGFTRMEAGSAVLALLGIGGEALADAQLAGFKRAAPDRSSVCDAGLWRFSRHPNYFFEWVTWLGFFGFGLGSPEGWLGVVGPAAILYFLLGVTGIPMTERQSLASKGAAFRRYQETTSAFIPWVPKGKGARPARD